MMPIMTKLVTSTGRIQVICLMAVAVDFTVWGPMVGDAAKRVRVKPLSRPQTWQMPPRSPDSVSLLCRQLAPITWRPRDRSPGEMGGREEPTPHRALTANGGARFPAQPLSPAATSETVTSGWSRQELTAEVVLTDFQKKDW